MLGKAYLDVFKSLRNPTVFSELETQLIEMGVRAGSLDQSFATEMAAQAHGDVLQRMRGGNKISQLAQRITGYGLWPFKFSEGINRRVSFLAAIRLAQEKGGIGLSVDELFQAGRDAVDKTQFEYSRWARMPIARGGRKLGSIAPLLFMFQSYMQGTLYFYATQPGRGRALVAMLLMAGLMGLPGAEDVSDFL